MPSSKRTRGDESPSTRKKQRTRMDAVDDRSCQSDQSNHTTSTIDEGILPTVQTLDEIIADDHLPQRPQRTPRGVTRMARTQPSTSASHSTPMPSSRSSDTTAAVNAKSRLSRRLPNSQAASLPVTSQRHATPARCNVYDVENIQDFESDSFESMPHSPRLPSTHHAPKTFTTSQSPMSHLSDSMCAPAFPPAAKYPTSMTSDPGV